MEKKKKPIQLFKVQTIKDCMIFSVRENYRSRGKKWYILPLFCISCRVNHQIG